MRRARPTPAALAAGAMLITLAAGPPVVGRETLAPFELRSVPLADAAKRLEKRYGTPVVVARELQDCRITLRAAPGDSPAAVLGTVAGVLGARLVREAVEGRTTRYHLRLPQETTATLARWKRAALFGAVARQVAAAQQYQRSLSDPAVPAPPGGTLALGYADVPLRAVSGFGEGQWSELLRGEWTRVPAAAIAPEDRRRMLEGLGRAWESARPGLGAGFIERFDRTVADQGLLLRLEPSRLIHGAVYLQLRFAPDAPMATTVAALNARDLSLPLTHLDPYRWLAAKRTPPEPELPAAFRRPLADDLTLAGDGTWGATLLQLAQACGLPVASDDYLCRVRESPPAAGSRAVIAPKGTPLADALDALCRRFGYVWWEKDGRACLLSGTRPWDSEEETPERFFETWRRALSGGRAPSGATLTAVATLTWPQVIGLSRLGTDRGENSSAAVQNPALPETLALVRELTPKQQGDLLTTGRTQVPFEQLARSPVLRRSTHASGGTLTLALGAAVVPAERGGQPGWQVTQRFTWTGAERAEVATLGFWVSRAAPDQ